MKKRVIIPALLVVVIVLVIGYFQFMNQDDWCPSGTVVGNTVVVGMEDKEIRGGRMRTCLYESRYDSGGVRMRSWETRNREYICNEFYKKNISQYSITYWSEGDRRCQEIKRINNRFVPEGVECTEI